MINLFETADLVKSICRKSKNGMFREFWTDNLKTELFDIIETKLRESAETEELLGTVKEKMSGFLNQVKSRLDQIKATYQEKKVFFSHLVNLIFSTVGAGIEGPPLSGTINRVRTEFPRDYEKGDSKQAAFIRRQYERMKDIFQKQNNPNPHEAAIDYIKNTWKGLSDNLLRTLGKEPKARTPKVSTEPVKVPEPVASPIIANPELEKPKVDEPPKETFKSPPLGKHKMTMDEIIDDAKKHLDLIKKTVHSKDAQKKAVRRYVGDKHFDKSLSRNPMIDVVVDKLFGTDRLENSPGEDRDKEVAKTYLSMFKAARSAATGAKNPTVKDVVQGLDDLIQAADSRNLGYLRVIITPIHLDSEGSPEGILALSRTRIRAAGYQVGDTEKDYLGKNQPDAYKIYFSKPKRK